VIAGTFLLAIAAGHRLGEASRRWILLGISIYAVMRIAILLASGPSNIPSFSTAAIVAGVFVTLPLMAGVSLLGARRACRTQAGSTRGSTSTGCGRRIATRLWRCSTKPPPLGALEVVGD
jgi:hypothetical protein